MKNFRILALGTALVFFAACDSTGPGAQCDQTTSQVQAMMTGATTAQGQVSGYLEGSMTFEITQRQEHADGTETLQTRHVFTTADGELRTQDTGTLGPMQADSTRTVNATATIQSGTGSFANASGTLTADGMVNYTTEPAPTLSGSYTGQICF